MASMDMTLMKLSEALENLMFTSDVLVKKKKEIGSYLQVSGKSLCDARNRHANNSFNPATGKYSTCVSYSPTLL